LIIVIGLVGTTWVTFARLFPNVTIDGKYTSFKALSECGSEVNDAKINDRMPHAYDGADF